MTEIGEGVYSGKDADASTEELEDNHWLEIEYLYQSGAPIYGTFKVTDAEGMLWVGTLNDEGKACLAGLPDGEAEVELLPEENVEDQVAETRKEIQAVLERIIEDQKAQAAEYDEELQQETGIQKVFTHVHGIGNTLWECALGVQELVVNVGNTVYQYSVLDELNSVLKAGFQSYQDGELNREEWLESLDKNLSQEQKNDLIGLFVGKAEYFSRERMAESFRVMAEAYEMTALVAGDSKSRDMLVDFAAEMAKSQSSVEWTKLAAAGIFELILGAILATTTGGSANATRAATKLRHFPHMEDLGHLFKKLARQIKQKNLNKKIKAPVDKKTTTKTDQPEPIDLKPKRQPGLDDPRLKTAPGASPHPGRHNKAWPKGKKGVDAKEFKPDGSVDMDNLTQDQAVAKENLLDNGWGGKKVQEVLESGSEFRTKEYQAGDRLYGFTSEDFAKDIDTSPYWLDQEGLDELSKDYYSNGAWDREGVKNHLALPCYNRANAIDVAEVTEPHTGVESSINPASELISYTNDSGSTGLIPKKMSGGGTQVALDPSKITSLKSQ